MVELSNLFPEDDDVPDEQAEYILEFIILIIKEEKNKSILEDKFRKIERKYLNVNINMNVLWPYLAEQKIISLNKDEEQPRVFNIHEMELITLMELACRKANLAAVKLLLNEHDASEIDEEIIAWAISGGNLEIIKEIDKYKANFEKSYEFVGVNSVNALQNALLSEKMDIFNYLYKKKKNLLYSIENEMDIISHAIDLGKYKTIKHILQLGYFDPTDLYSVQAGHGKLKIVKSFDVILDEEELDMAEERLEHFCDYVFCDGHLAVFLQLLLFGVKFTKNQLISFIRVIKSIKSEYFEKSQSKFSWVFLEMLKKLDVYEAFSDKDKEEIEELIKFCREKPQKYCGIIPQESIYGETTPQELSSLKNICINYIKSNCFFSQEQKKRLPTDLQREVNILHDILPENIFHVIDCKIAVAEKEKNEERRHNLEKIREGLIKNLSNLDSLHWLLNKDSLNSGNFNAEMNQKQKHDGKRGEPDDGYDDSAMEPAKTLRKVS